MNGPLLTFGDSGPLRGWALKKTKFSEIFFEQIVLAKKPPDGRKYPSRGYWILALLRILITFLPQTGYIHPDEFFQTLEPVAGSVLDVEWTRSWEFNSSFPLRNMVLSHLSIGIPLRIFQNINGFLYEYTNTALIIPYTLIVLPRLSFCLLSFINDYCLYKICHLYGENFNRKLIFMASSYVTLIYSTHTFSNSLEMILLSILLLLVSECMLTSGCIIHHSEIINDKYEKATSVLERVKLHKLRKLLPDYSLRKCLQIATVTTIGIFNRPTFVGFAFPSIFLWLLRGLGSKYIGFKDFHARLIVFIINCMPALLCLILIDSNYYGYLTLSDIESHQVSLNNFVVTPLNFLKYNLLSENLEEHGIHPRWLHIFVNLPLLFNVLTIIGFISIVKIIYRITRGHFRTLPRIQSIDGLMAFSVIIPVLILSLFPHQEPRFLIPIQLPLVYICTRNLQHDKSDKRWKRDLKTFIFVTWCFFNVVLSLFFGFIHQGGIYSAANHIHSEIHAKPKFSVVHVVTSHIYNMPQTLFLTDDTTKIQFDRKTQKHYRLMKKNFLYELGSKPVSDVVKHVQTVWKVSEAKLRNKSQTFRLYLILPSSLKYQLNNIWGEPNATSLILKEEKHFFPHLSTEALPYYPMKNDPSCISDFHYTSDVTWDVKLTSFGQFVCFMSQFSLSIYKIEKFSNMQ